MNVVLGDVAISARRDDAGALQLNHQDVFEHFGLRLGGYHATRFKNSKLLPDIHYSTIEQDPVLSRSTGVCESTYLTFAGIQNAISPLSRWVRNKKTAENMTLPQPTKTVLVTDF